MEFIYTAYDLTRGVVKGRIDARTPAEAEAEVRRSGYKPLAVKPARSSAALQRLFPSLYRVSAAELVRFSRHMASMLSSGSNLVRVLEMLQRETKNRRMHSTLEAIQKTLDEGGSFSDALAQHPLVFSQLYVSIVEVGEYTGRLGPALDEMANMLEQDLEAKQKAVRTLMYPAAIIGLAVVTMSVLMIFALPPMLKVFERMGTQVPLVTRITMSAFAYVQSHFIQLAGGAVLLLVLFVLLRQVPRIRYWMDRIQLKIPVLGSLVMAKELSRFARTLAILLEAGVTLANALRLSIAGCNNVLLKRVFLDAEESLLSGRGLSASLKSSHFVPSMFVELIAMGEESNALPRAMTDVATAYQKRLEQRMASLLGMLEPVSTMVVGGIVALIAFSMFVPIYASLDSFK